MMIIMFEIFTIRRGQRPPLDWTQNYNVKSPGYCPVSYKTRNNQHYLDHPLPLC